MDSNVNHNVNRKKRKRLIPAGESMAGNSRFRPHSGVPINLLRLAGGNSNSSSNPKDDKESNGHDVLLKFVLQQLSKSAAPQRTKPVALNNFENIIVFIPTVSFINLCDDDNDEEKKDEKLKGVVRSIPMSDIPPCPSRQTRGEPSNYRCNICSYPVPPPLVWSRIRCKHIFCVDCIRDYVIEKFQENLGELKCPLTNCKEIIKPNSLKWIIPEEVIDRWERSLQEANALKKSWEVSCPFPDCRAKSVDDQRNYLIRACPSCWRLYCFNCMVAWHFGETCVQYRSRQYWLRLKMINLCNNCCHEISDSD